MLTLLALIASFVSPLQQDINPDIWITDNSSVESVHFVNGDLVVVWQTEPGLSTIPPQPTYKYRETYKINNDELELVKLEVWRVERSVRSYWENIPIGEIPIGAGELGESWLRVPIDSLVIIEPIVSRKGTKDE